jgi:hypothetical protein
LPQHFHHVEQVLLLNLVVEEQFLRNVCKHDIALVVVAPSSNCGQCLL